MTIEEIASELKLSYIRNNSQRLIDEANHLQMTYDEFLLNLLQEELDLRRDNGVKRRIRNAKFPYKKYLEDFDMSIYITQN